MAADGRPTPDTTSLLDTPEDYFRIRLVCTLLDTCGVYFERGLLRKKMDNFLVFFQMYIKVKRQPLPMDIDFMVSDTFETLRPKLVLFATFEEAAMAVDDMFAKASVQSAAISLVVWPYDHHSSPADQSHCSARSYPS
jgi:regulator of nonsense transcripts 2